MTRDTADIFAPPDRGRFGDNEQESGRVSSARVTGASDLKDFTLALHRDDPKDKAILLSEAGEEDKAFWCPRSAIEYHDTGKQTKGKRRNGQSVVLALVEVAMPQWLAKQRGLL